MARVLALGAGAMGSTAARILSAYDEVDSIVVADLNRQSAERAALECHGKGQAMSVDVTRNDDVARLMKDFDIVMNCVGPFFRFGVPILEAAIAAGVNYADICDDPEPTRDMLEMNDKARVRGMTAIVGMGASPGITNLLGACAYRSLDRADEMLAAWNIEEDTGGKASKEIEFSAAVVHWMQQCSGKILECSDGRLADGRPLEDIVIHSPNRGRRTLYSVGHPEPVSFYYSYPGLKRTRCAMVMPSDHIGFFRMLQQQIDSKKLTLEQAGRKLVESANAPLNQILGFFAGWFTDEPRLPCFFSTARGIKDRRAAAVFASIQSIPAGMDGATGIPLALGTLMLLRGQVRHQGVLAPEKAVDPDVFFNLLAPYCTVPGPCSADELVKLEWAD
ncbi:MAG: saccharopine dehydrogenase NADP-binding domain-containing protein [Syntrophobacteraceae bacterium]